jgi:hypothetical protein
MEVAGYPVMYLQNTFAFRILQHQINALVSIINHGKNIKYVEVPSAREFFNQGESLQYRHRSTLCSPFTSSMEKARRYRTSLRAMKIYTLRSQPHYSIVQYSAPIKRLHPIATPSLSLTVMFLLLFIQETGNVFQVGADKL